MKIRSVPNALILQLDLKVAAGFGNAPGTLRGYVLAFVSKTADIYQLDMTEAADFVTWHCTLDPGATELVCESGNYLHLSPNWTMPEFEAAEAASKRDFDLRRGVLTQSCCND